MRKWIWGGAFVGLAAAGLGTYLAMQPDLPLELPSPELAEEDFAVPAGPPVPLGDLVRTTSEPSEPEVDAFEPIVVESTRAAVVGPDWAIPEEPFGVQLGIQVPVAAQSQPPRPDEEPGQQRTMPYAEQPSVALQFVTRLWQSMRRLLTGQPAVETRAIETPEPPIAEVKTPVKPDSLAPLFPPVMNDYHRHDQCCPYTGRCPLPYHPAPPTLPDSK
jgi:hypothetical protein